MDLYVRTSGPCTCGYPAHEAFPLTRSDRTVDDEHVAVKNVRVPHGVAADPHLEGGLRMFDQVFQGIDAFADVIIGGGGKPGLHSARHSSHLQAAR